MRAGGAYGTPDGQRSRGAPQPATVSRWGFPNRHTPFLVLLELQATRTRTRTRGFGVAALLE
jgi:hypothetical protein